MSADINTYITIDKKNKKDSFVKVLKYIKSLEDSNNDFHLDFVQIKEDGKNTDSKVLRDMNDSNIEEFVSKLKKDLIIDAGGPYGRYLSILETGIFQGIADVDFGLLFRGNSSGFNTGGDISLDANMHDGLLHFIEYFETDDDHDEHISFVKNILDFSTFCNLFEIDEEEYDESDYENFLPDYLAELTSLSGMELDEFLDYFETNIDEEKYNEINETLSMLDVMYFDTFNNNYNVKASINYIRYNPETKKTEDDEETKEIANSKKRELIEKMKISVKNQITQLLN